MHAEQNQERDAAPEQILDRLLDRHGRTYADQLGIDLARGGSAEMFQLLVGALLMSARVRSDVAVAAARALFDHGYTDPASMLDATWQDRVDALGEGHYVRYDESTATYLADTSTLLQQRYDGDLRRLREAADGDRDRIHALLQECKGIGRVGADIFCREAQLTWDELRPFVDRSALDVADQLGLASSVEELAELCGDDDLSTVASALVRAKQEDDLDAVRGDAGTGLTSTQAATKTRDELYELAQERDLEGRSTMSRDELVAALRS